MSGFSGHKRGVRREVITSSGDDWRNAPEEPDVPKDKPTMDAINLALHGNYVFASLPEEDVETVVRKMHCVTVRRARARAPNQRAKNHALSCLAALSRPRARARAAPRR